MSKLLDVGGGINVGQPNRRGVRTVSQNGGKTVGYVSNVTDEDLLNGKVERVEALKTVDPDEARIAAIRAEAERKKAAKAKKSEKEPAGDPDGTDEEETPDESEAG